jgi:chemotaxis regulatin CheY-phosphate phosphatase CheZ
MSESETNTSGTGAQKAAESVNEMFQEALRNYEKALKSGIELQEESVNLWKTLLTQLTSPDEFQAKLESMQSEVFPTARKRMEEFVDLFNQSSNQTLELFEKSMSVYQAKSMTDAQRRLQDLMESSIATLRGNVQTALNTNTKIISSWKDILDRFSPAGR